MNRTLLAAASLAGILTGVPALPVSPGTFLPTHPPPVDSAREELEIGRHWHAARILRTVAAERPLTPDETLLLARADAGYFHWNGVLETLDGVGWLDEEDGGAGWRLLGRAREETGRWGDASSAYARYLASEAGRAAPDRDAVRVRRVRSLVHADAVEPALELLDVLVGSRGVLASWTALELAGERATEGDTVVVRGLLARATDDEAAARGWELPALAAIEAGDSVRAEEAYRVALADLEPEDAAARGRAWARIGDLRLAGGDTVAAVAAWKEGLVGGGTTPPAATSAERLLEHDGLDPALALRAARTLSRWSGPRAALRAFDLYVASTEATEGERLNRARLMARIPPRRAEAVREFRALSTSESEGVGAGALESWADLRRRQGRSGDVATLRRWLLERYPASSEAVEVVFLRADAAHDRGETGAALSRYARIQEMNPVLDRAGLARMRSAQIHLGEGRRGEALEVFRGYLADFPEGRRWEEASYWSGRLLLEGVAPAEAGDDVGAVRAEETGTTGAEEGRGLLQEVLARSPLSYYAVQAAHLLGDPYRPPGLGRRDAPSTPGWMVEGLTRLELAGAAGLEEAADVVVDRLRRQALATTGAEVLGLALALAERGRTIEAIRLGRELRSRDRPWSRELLEALYPFPYREMVMRSARERKLDPILVAALIRQESAFDRDIVSSAGAVGLMQVLPTTGREIARSEGVRGFSQASLETPEINLLLGTRFLRDLWDRHGAELPIVLSAYNAGPSRARRWRRFPEAADPLRFTERIPFTETRDYVKRVTRNQALYEALYGGA